MFTEQRELILSGYGLFFAFSTMNFLCEHQFGGGIAGGIGVAKPHKCGVFN